MGNLLGRCLDKALIAKGGEGGALRNIRHAKMIAHFVKGANQPHWPNAIADAQPCKPVDF